MVRKTGKYVGQRHESLRGPREVARVAPSPRYVTRAGQNTFSAAVLAVHTVGRLDRSRKVRNSLIKQLTMKFLSAVGGGTSSDPLCEARHNGSARL